MSKAPVQHIDRISRAVETYAAVPVHNVVERSWFRSATAYGVDPAQNHSPKILTANELRDFRDPAERLIATARGELDRLYALVRHARYVVLLCDKKGVVIDHRGEDGEAVDFRYWGTWLGGIWSEESEGTNGIGTCLVEQQPVTVHRSQHFRARHIGLSCSGAPLFDPEGELFGVLDVSCIDPKLSEHAHALTGALTIAAARAIEERLFRERYCREWIAAVALPTDAGSAMLIAMDSERRIVGLDRTGRQYLASRLHAPAIGAGIWDVFERDETIYRHKEREDLWARLQLRDGGSLTAILTRPARFGRLTIGHDDEFMLRPRLDALQGGLRMQPASRSRGGLPPAALRRVREYIDAHLDENVDLNTLASTAGLSLYHFARAFKQSEGVTPHLFLLQQRLAKAQNLLVDQRLSLAEIALSVGFADQSHFARRFREMVGVPPGQFRRLRQ